MTQEPERTTGGPLPGGEPDDVAEASTPGSDGDGPESGYTSPTTDDEDADTPGSR